MFSIWHNFLANIWNNTIKTKFCQTQFIFYFILLFIVWADLPLFHLRNYRFDLHIGGFWRPSNLYNLLYTVITQQYITTVIYIFIYRVSLSLEAPNYCLCIQLNSAGFWFVNTSKQVHLKHARRHFERNLVKDVHHRSVASRNWLKS